MPAGAYPPALLPGADDLLTAFWECHSDRTMGGIPFMTIDRYAARFGFDDIDEFDLFNRMMREMDDEYLSATGRKKKPMT